MRRTVHLGLGLVCGLVVTLAMGCGGKKTSGNNNNNDLCGNGAITFHYDTRSIYLVDGLNLRRIE